MNRRKCYFPIELHLKEVSACERLSKSEPLWPGHVQQVSNIGDILVIVLLLNGLGHVVRTITL